MYEQVATLESNEHDALSHRTAQPAGVSPSAPARPTARFQYASGNTPLAGYTIKRGVGQGGFGEIYYAVSDAGKEVALKLIRRNLEVELRGIRQCLNLKHPHLLDLYDIRQDDQGDTWVVMEFIADRCLEDVLASQPNGVPPEEALAWIHGVGAGVAYLHDRGIVHRDLKPGNIFCNEGVVKVGDYGLSKFISCSRRSGHTESIGTVHYMAPEVANGRYGKEIDVYALGILLYELLTGHVPFEGESIGEVLMKHMTARPDVSMLPDPYRTVVAQALEKDPALRFRSAADMLAALPKPNGGQLLYSARRPASPGPTVLESNEPVAAGSTPADRHFHETIVTAQAVREEPILRAARQGWHRIKTSRERLADLFGALLLSALVAAAMCVVMVLIEQFRADAAGVPRPERFAWLLLVSVAGAWAVLIPSKFWEGTRGDPMVRRFFLMVLGLAVGAAAFAASDFLLVSLPPDAGYPEPLGYKLPTSFYAHDGRPLLLSYMACFGTLFLLVRWWIQADPMRSTRLSLWKLIVTLFVAGMVALVWQFPQPWLPMVAGTMSVAVQMASPWRRTGRWRR